MMMTTLFCGNDEISRMLWLEEDETLIQDVIDGVNLVLWNHHIDHKSGLDSNRCHHLDFVFHQHDSILSSQPYSNHPPEWPAAVEIADKWELPTIVSQRFKESAADGFSLCGMFPEIRRAWASVNNSIFLWPFDKWLREEKCIEYNSGEQVVCAVGLTAPKPDVFTDDIQYILVLATPTRLILVGVCCTRICDEEVPYAELSLHPLPYYTIESDGVAMTCITCTDKGRIFMGGRDGHIYELEYFASSFWQMPCRKVCVTSDLASVVSRFVGNPFRSRAVDPVNEMVFDSKRQTSTLYVKTEAMKLQVYELGQSGDARTVLEESNIVGIGGSSKPSIVSISRVSLEESFSLQLVVVLSDGRRMYCQTRDYEADKMGYKPRYCFRVVSIRSPPLEYLNDDIPVKFKTSYYSAGTLVLSNSSSTSGDDSSLTIVSKDYSTLHSKVGYIGTLVHSNRVLNESVNSFSVDGKILSVVDVLPLPDVAMTLDYLYLKYFEEEMARSPCEFLVKETAKLWSRRDLSLQHMLPRRRVVVFSSMGMMELVFNRPVDILRRLLESNSSKSSLEYFFKRYGTTEGAAMCLLLAANIADNESRNYGNITDSILTNKAAQVYENLESLGTSGFDGCSGLSNRKRVVNRFSYGARYVSDVEPVFSGAYEGLCFCSTRLLGPLLADVNITRDRASDSTLGEENLVVECRMSLKSMKFLENKLRSLARYLKSMMINKKGVYARVGDHSQNFKLSDSPTDLATMEVKVTECLCKLLSRSSEALFLLQLLSKHDLAILGQNTDRKYKEGVLCLSFEKLVSSKEGHMLATRLISALIESTTGARDEVIEELRKGCPSYFNEKTYKFYLAMYCLKRAIASSTVAKREDLARQAFNYLNQVPISADLQIICRKFENLRFYDAVVLLPLQKAQAIPAQREDCYEIIGRALRNLEEGVVLRRDFLSPIIIEFGRSILDPSIRSKYISQLVQVAVQSPDKMFHEYLYRTMIDIGLEDELLKYASHDLDHFLQQAVSEPRNEVNGALSSTQVNYLRLLGRYYFNKFEHLLAAEVLLSLAERRCISSNRTHVPSLEERFQYLDDALLQAKFVTDDAKTKCTPTGVFVDDFLRMVDEKLALARFQRKIKKEVEFMASSYESRTGISKTRQAEDIPEKRVVDLVSCAREKVNELSSELKSITQLLKDYVVPFELWEICGEMLYFFKQNKSDNNIMREVWRTIIDQSLSRGGFAEASFILKKFSAYFDVSYETLLPFDLLCFHLEKMCSAKT